MTQAPTCQWTGRSGTVYQHSVYPIGQTFDPVPGNYIFAKVVEGRWNAVYIGQTADLSERFDGHHKMQCIRAHGATHIHARRNNGGERARRVEEKDLIENYNPPCNG